MPKPKRYNRSRGVSANELLNSTLPPPPEAHGHHHGGGCGRRPPPDPLALRRAFMLQNFQFVLRREAVEARAAGARRLQAAAEAADEAVPWAAVHSVVTRTSVEDFACPVCLEAPLAPRVAECGHVICLPCALFHLRVQRERGLPRSCPVCHVTLVTQDLRPCVPAFVHPPRPGAVSVFDHFCKERGCCTVRRFDDPALRPAARGGASGGGDCAWLPECAVPSSVQSRYVVSTAAHEAALRYQELTSISERLSDIQRQERPLHEYDARMEDFLIESFNVATRDAPAPAATNSPVVAPQRGHHHGHHGHHGHRQPPPPPPAHHQDPQQGAAAAAGQPPRYLDLYALADGQPVYLHMLSARMLLADAEARGAPLPDTVSALVEEVVTFTQTEETRRIYKVFAHVPLHGTVHLCVVNLDAQVLPETLNRFRSEIGARRQRRRERLSVAEAAALTPEDAWEQYKTRYRVPSSRGHNTATTATHRNGNGNNDSASQSPSVRPSEDPCAWEADTASLRLPSAGSTAHSEHGLTAAAPGAPSGGGTGRSGDTEEETDEGDALPAAGAGSNNNNNNNSSSEGVCSPPLTVTALGAWSKGGCAARLRQQQGAAKSASAGATQPTWGGHALQFKRKK